MGKKTTVLAVNPVNGSGLFQYLETFFENGIGYKVFAVADTRDITTNSGIPLRADDVISALRGHEDEYEAVVFACGDAVPKFMDNATEQYNVDLIQVLRTFAESGKPVIGHCGVAVLLEAAGVTDGVRFAIHPFAKGALQKGIATDEPFTEDGRFLTVQTENTLHTALDRIVEILK